MVAVPTTGLADDVLPLIRSRGDLYRWSAANAHGYDMHQAIDILEQDTVAGPAERYAVTHKALTSAIKVIARADDSSGIIGDACRRLLDLHPRIAAAAQIKPSKLIDWMIKFQFDDSDVDYFELDIAAYAPALGAEGVSAYRNRLAEIEASLGPRPSREDRWQSSNSHAWFTLDWNAKRLAVLDRDIDAIIRTHVRDRKVAAWFTDTAEAFEEIGEYALAIDWARQATEFGLGHQSVTASRYWIKLLETHRPADVRAARLFLFRRWPNSSTATELHRAAGDDWPIYRDEAMAALSRQPYDAVTFILRALGDARAAWQLAHDLCLDDDHGWAALVEEYEKIDRLAVLPVHERLVRNTLTNTGAEHYRRAAVRLARMRTLAADTTEAANVDELITELREEHKRRPRLQQEFTRVGLP
ncbi:DUF6880 family protein [Nocardioides sp. Iso805N]|uniref:DUF6880 family protein n=1 Tax=Nocardioides sp. Iso805N TaxID=1283287 RepID=UPI000382F1F8|nr:DUF6880 family protein [Nocardioides sp. Iso805N]